MKTLDRSTKPIKVCICTSYPAYAEPRAPRHALAIAELGNQYEVVFVDCFPHGSEPQTPQILQGRENITHQTCFFPYKRAHIARFLLEKGRQFVSRRLVTTLGYMDPSVLSTRAVELERLLERLDADVYLGYNIDTLIPIQRVAHKKGALTVFDCQEFYSDMGSWQTEKDKRIIRSIERRYLAQCDLVLAASNQMADEIADAYKIPRPLPLYNAAPTEVQLKSEKEPGFTLYWRNSTVDLGQRGLGDVIAALSLLPEEIVLHLQGNVPADGGKRLRGMIAANGLSQRVFQHAPYAPRDAVKAASRYTVGLCLEQATNRNQLLTVSNKMFDYLMAGLPVIASDLPGLRNVIDSSGGGLLYQPGNPQDLANKIQRLYTDRSLLKRLAVNARSFALAEGNLENELAKLKKAFVRLLEPAPRRVA